jgi:phosphoglycolate phosphatase
MSVKSKTPHALVIFGWSLSLVVLCRWRPQKGACQSGMRTLDADRKPHPNPMPPAIIVFDLDGTLVDTAPDLVATLNAVFTRAGLKAMPYDVVRDTIGRGARAMIERSLATQGQRLADAEIDRLFTAYIDYYAAHIADHSRPFPGLETALDDLATAGYRFAVCTNKLEGLSRRLLDALGLTRRFEFICGQDTFGSQKPDPEVLRKTIAKARGRVDRAIMVGDSATDIATARAADVPVIAVDFGYTDIPIAQLQPDKIISNFSALPAAVAELISVW